MIAKVSVVFDTGLCVCLWTWCLLCFHNLECNLISLISLILPGLRPDAPVLVLGLWGSSSFNPQGFQWNRPGRSSRGTSAPVCWKLCNLRTSVITSNAAASAPPSAGWFSDSLRPPEAYIPTSCSRVDGENAGAPSKIPSLALLSAPSSSRSQLLTFVFQNFDKNHWSRRFPLEHITYISYHIKFQS